LEEREGRRVDATRALGAACVSIGAGLVAEAGLQRFEPLNLETRLKRVG
jgi:hypothetical protein